MTSPPTIRKVLASAVANAVHNDEQDADELFVLACFADEGPTLRRFRPRARGRATRIRKRTCHITVVVARMSDERLEVVQARQQAAAAAGRRRAGTVGASPPRPRRAQPRRGPRACAATRRRPTTTTEATEDDAERRRRRRRRDEVAADEAEVEVDAERRRPRTSPTSESSTSRTSRVADEADADGVELPTAPSARPRTASIPEGYEIKGNANSMKYHVPGGRYYDVTIAEVFFDTAEHAEAAGYEAPAHADDERTSN